MKRESLRMLDLNLLPILSILLEERSVTATGKRVFLSQSATSSVLRRLRETYQDEILIRDGQTMVPTRKAQAIEDELYSLLERLAELLMELKGSTEEQEIKVIRIAAPEYIATVLSPVFSRVISDPDNSKLIEIHQFARKKVHQQLRDGQFDLVIGVMGDYPDFISHQRLLGERLVVVCRADHPATRTARDRRISLEDFQSYPHIQVSDEDEQERTWIARMLKRDNISRRLGASVHRLHLAEELVKDTDFLCVGTERLYEHLHSQNDGLDFLLLPEEFSIRRYDVDIAWHRDMDESLFLSEFRDFLREQLSEES